MGTYICSKCKIEKDLVEFPKASDRKSGHRSSCKECERIRSKKYHVENKDKINKHKAEYFQENKERIQEYQTIHRKDRLNKDSIFKTRVNVGKLIQLTFKRCGFKKDSKSKEILGCTYKEFKTYLESKFEPWMNWDNYGLYNGESNYGWDLDHIIPISSAITEEDVYRLSHYTNFQPLCSFTNRYIKRDKQYEYKT